jgi:hypothetical protein
MTSLLAWIDHDPAERERMQRILALFEERDTRDELGIGAIRDSFADQFFPGTSTIQTRIRYLLFVPWIYRRIEQEQIASARIAAVARQRELDLAKVLAPGGDWGVFGKTAGGALKRLPSSVYWAGLQSWGIRQFHGSQDQYHRALDEIYRRRRFAERREDGEAGWERAPETWHPSLPEPPARFPAEADFKLTVREAEFLRERIVTTQPSSLLAFLAVHVKPANVEYPWLHPDLGRFPGHMRELLEHARLFSEVMEGAAILYNLMLAELAERQALVEEHGAWLTDWAESLDHDAIQHWDLDRLWHLTTGRGHTIAHRAKTFVSHWVQLVISSPTTLHSTMEARELVQRRESSLKGGRSRFTNRRVLDQWTGYAGMQPLDFRWRTAKDFLNDLNAVPARTARV